MLTFANKGARGWARALMIVMLSLSLTLSMPAKPAMALVTVPTIDVKGVPVWIKQLVEQVATKLINMAMQKLMQEANKALGKVANMPMLAEILKPTLDGISQDLTGMLTRGSNDLLGNIFRSPQQNFQDCMGNIACTSNIQLSNNFTASFSSPAFNNTNTDFTVLSPAQLPAGLSQYGSIAGQASYPLAFAAPPVQDGGFYTADLTNGASIKFSLPSGTNVGSMTSLPANVAFTTTDASVSPDFLKTMNLNVGNGALTFSNVSVDGGNPYTMTASAPLRQAIDRANSTNEVQTVNGIEVKPGLTVGSDGKIGGDIATALNFGGAQVSATVGANGVSNLSVGDLSKALCPNLTEADKLGGKVCGAAQTAISGLLGCVSGGNIGNCAKNVGQNVAKSLLGGIGQALGGALKGGGQSNSGLQVEAGQQALFAQYFCAPNDNTPECIAQKTALRNADLAFKTTEHIANVRAWQVKFPEIKKDIDKNIGKLMQKCDGGNANCIAAAQLFQKQAYEDLNNAKDVIWLKSQELDALARLPLLPTAIPPKG